MANDGKLLETRLSEALRQVQEARPSFFHRFADTRTARNYMPVQPGDFLWLLPGYPAILIEAKSTVRSASLRSLLKPAQAGKHRLWLRAGHLTAFVYADLVRDQVGWYDGGAVLEKQTRLVPLAESSLATVRGLLEGVLETIQKGARR